MKGFFFNIKLKSATATIIGVIQRRGLVIEHSLAFRTFVFVLLFLIGSKNAYPGRTGQKYSIAKYVMHAPDTDNKIKNNSKNTTTQVK